jgi:O-antigen ligase
MMIFCVLAVARGWLHPLSLIALVLAVMIVLGLLSGVIFERITADDNGAAYSRVPLMEIAFRIIKDYPVLGIGANNFSIVIPSYVSAYSGVWVHTVHNKYLLIWSEIGLGGLLSFLWFLGAAIWQGWRALHTQDRVLSSLAMGLMAGLIGQMAHMMVDIFNDRPQVQAVWMLAALLAALDHLYTSYQGTPTKAPTEVTV